MIRHRFDSKGNVVVEARRLMPYFGKDDYRTGMPIFEPRHSSPARLRFKEARRQARAHAS